VGLRHIFQSCYNRTHNQLRILAFSLKTDEKLQRELRIFLNIHIFKYRTFIQFWGNAQITETQNDDKQLQKSYYFPKTNTVF
jgi:hypothetical protein